MLEILSPAPCLYKSFTKSAFTMAFSLCHNLMSVAVSVHLSESNSNGEGTPVPVLFMQKVVGNVDTRQFGKCSKRFENELYCGKRTVKDPVVIEASVEMQAVTLFIEVCQGKSRDIDISLVDDMLAIGEEWDVKELVEPLRKFCSEREDEFLVTSLVHRLEKGRQTRDLELKLHDAFPRICKNEFFVQNIATIGLPVFYRVFSINDHDLVKDHLVDIFPFMRTCVDQYFKFDGSVLFAGIDLRQLNQEQLCWVKNAKHLDHQFLSDSYLRTISEQNATIAKYEQLVQDMKQEHEALVSEFTAFKDSVNKEILARLDKFEQAMSDQEAKLEKRNKDMEQAIDQQVKQSLEKLRVEAQNVSKEAQQESANALNLFKKTTQSNMTALMKAAAVHIYYCTGGGGIIAYLRQLCGGDVCDKRVVDVRGSSCIRDVKDNDFYASKPQNVVSDSTNGFFSQNIEGSWVEIDFKDRRVALTGYSITRHHEFPQCCVKSWEILGMNDGSEEPMVIDSRSNDFTLRDGTSATQYFEVNKPVGPFRIIRLKQVGRTADDKHYQLVIQAFELFGVLVGQPTA